MKLVFISDTHGYLRERDIPDGDVLIHCGDACSSGRMFEFQEFVSQMEKLRHRFKAMLYTPGNHERCVQDRLDVCQRMTKDVGISMLMHESIEVDGVKFFGSPWTPEFGSWAFMYPREKGKEIWAQIPDDTDVLFTHGMPHGILDRVGRIMGKDEDEHVGCEALLDRILEIEPKVFAGGHLHLQGGQQVQTASTLFVNAAICDDSYTPLRKPIEVEYESTALKTAAANL